MVLGLSLRYTTSSSFLLPYLGATALRISLVFGCLAPTLSLVKRIKQEEAMLAKEFGNEWKEYCKKTWRLVPSLW
jgi:protein-S-isoprenylcysteine O-methyltransferase Ste14